MLIWFVIWFPNLVTFLYYLFCNRLSWIIIRMIILLLKKTYMVSEPHSLFLFHYKKMNIFWRFKFWHVRNFLTCQNCYVRKFLTCQLPTSEKYFLTWWIFGRQNFLTCQFDTSEFSDMSIWHVRKIFFNFFIKNKFDNFLTRQVWRVKIF